MEPSAQGTPDRSHPIAVIAIGGNSLITDKEHQDVDSQWGAVHETAKHIASVVERGWTVVVTHGNGPQVGFILRRNEIAAVELHTTPLDLIVADTQGSIGYMLQQSLNNEFSKRNLYRRALTFVTQAVVDPNDPALMNPTKPIGSFMDEAKAQQMKNDLGWNVKEDSGRGWRRVIASPTPIEIVEQDAIRTAVNQGWIVIAGGGGGIPVIRTEQGLKGIAAVIDKDRLSALLAGQLNADMFIVSTGVEKVSINYGKPEQVNLDKMTASEAKKHLADGQFPAGSMGPKIESALLFLEQGGREALITDPSNLDRAIRGETGTRIIRD